MGRLLKTVTPRWLRGGPSVAGGTAAGGGAGAGSKFSKTVLKPEAEIIYIPDTQVNLAPPKAMQRVTALAEGPE